MLPGLESLEARLRTATEEQDPTAFLLADHDWLRDLVEEYRGPARRGERLDEIKAAMLDLKPRLDLHIRREEEAYFPAVEDWMRESGQGSTFDLYGEHDAIRIRFDQILTALDRRSDVAAAYGALARSLLIHFENEEELVFRDAPAHLSDEARRQVIEKFDALDAEASGT
jgi:hemerythrin HHE cation binding domain-containing protein